MAEKLRHYFAIAKQRGGLPLQIKLAMRTTMSEPRAAAAPDTPANLQLFVDALRELLGDQNVPEL